MKKEFLMLIGLSAMICATATAQNYFTENTVWEEIGRATPIEEYMTIHYTLAEPGEMAGKECLKLYRTDNNDPATRTLQSYIHVDGDKVYFLRDLASGQWKLMYDFSIKAGETCAVEQFRDFANVPYDHPFTLTCLSETESTKTLEGEYAKVTWLTGIGNPAGVADNIYELFSGGQSQLIKVTSAGKTVYENTAMLAQTLTTPCAVKVTEGGVTVTGSAAGIPVTIHSVDGKCMHRSLTGTAPTYVSLPAGIYMVSVGPEVHKVLVR